jgi:hypothetical protein
MIPATVLFLTCMQPALVPRRQQAHLSMKSMGDNRSDIESMMRLLDENNIAMSANADARRRLPENSPIERDAILRSMMRLMHRKNQIRGEIELLVVAALRLQMARRR